MTQVMSPSEKCRIQCDTYITHILKHIYDNEVSNIRSREIVRLYFISNDYRFDTRRKKMINDFIRLPKICESFRDYYREDDFEPKEQHLKDLMIVDILEAHKNTHFENKKEIEYNQKRLDQVIEIFSIFEKLIKKEIKNNILLQGFRICNIENEVRIVVPNENACHSDFIALDTKITHNSFQLFASRQRTVKAQQTRHRKKEEKVKKMMNKQPVNLTKYDQKEFNKIAKKAEKMTEEKIEDLLASANKIKNKEGLLMYTMKEAINNRKQVLLDEEFEDGTDNDKK